MSSVSRWGWIVRACPAEHVPVQVATAWVENQDGGGSGIGTCGRRFGACSRKRAQFKVVWTPSRVKVAGNDHADELTEGGREQHPNKELSVGRAGSGGAGMGTVGLAPHEIGCVVVGGIYIVGITLSAAEGYNTDVSSTWPRSVGGGGLQYGCKLNAAAEVECGQPGGEGSTSSSFSVTNSSSRGTDYSGEWGFSTEVSSKKW